MKHTITLAFITIFIFQSSLSFAQDANQRVLGVRFSVPNNFGMIYKRQLKKENRYLRFTAGRFELTRSNTALPTGTVLTGTDLAFFTNVNISGAVGLENRRVITDKLNVIHGLTFILNSNYGLFEVDTFTLRTYDLMPGIGYLIGAQYNINDNLHLDVELVPMVTGSILTGSGSQTRSNFTASLDMYGIFLNLCYQFEKPEKRRR